VVDPILRLPACAGLPVRIDELQGSLAHVLGEGGVLAEALANLFGGETPIEPEGQPGPSLGLLVEITVRAPRVPDGEGMIEAQVAAWREGTSNGEPTAIRMEGHARVRPR
jgi:hypothetical protein